MTEDEIRKEFMQWYEHDTDGIPIGSLLSFYAWKKATELAEKRHTEEILSQGAEIAEYSITVNQLETQVDIHRETIKLLNSKIEKLQYKLDDLKETTKWNKNYGRRPVREGIKVRIKYRDEIIDEDYAETRDWTLNGNCHDIIEWQLAE